MHADTLSSLFESSATFEAGANHPLRLNKPDRAWIVTQGAVEIFYMPMKDGQQAGPRHWLCSIGERGALFGFAPDSLGKHGMILAVGKLGAKLAEVEKRCLLEPSPSAFTTAQSLADDWILGLLHGLLDAELTPKNCYPIDKMAGEEFEEDICLNALEGVHWISVISDQAYIFGNESFPRLEPGDIFPVSKDAWIKTGPGRAPSFQTTAELLEQGTLAPCIEAFQNRIARSMSIVIAKNVAFEQTRLHNKLTQNADVLDKGLKGLLFPSETTAAPDESEGTDPLFTCCLRVGKAAGIAMSSPPEHKRGGVEHAALRSIVKASNIRMRRVLLRGEWWRQNNGPLLCFLEEDRTPVALLQRTPVSYMLHAPDVDTPCEVDAEVAASLQPFAYMFYRSFPSEPLRLRQLFSFGFRGLLRDCLTVLTMGVTSGLLTLALPVLTAIVFDSILPMGMRGQLLQVGAALLVAALAAGLFNLTRAVSLLRMKGALTAHVQGAVMDRVLALPAGFFRKFNVGDMSDRALGVNSIAEVVTGTVINTLLSGVFSAFSVAILFYYDSKLGLVAAAMVASAMIVTMCLVYVSIRHQKNFVEISGKLSGRVFQYINGIAKLRVAGAEGKAYAAWLHRYRLQARSKFLSSLASARLNTFNAVYPVLFTMVIFAMAATHDDALQTGEFLAFVAAFSQLLAAGIQISSSMVSLLPLVPIYERAKPIFDEMPEIKPGQTDPGELSGNIEVQNVSFRYSHDGPLVLENISLEIRRNEFVALVGPSGCGKSTLLRLLLGFETPESGSIYYDNQNMQSLDIQAVRSQIGVVLQNSRILGGDIFRNIAGMHDLSQEDVWEAARRAGIDKDIKEMPMGLFTVIPAGGAGISGGQLQRLLIARAMASKPRMFFFDEATSALDNLSQAIISTSLEEFKASRIVVAHRLSTIKNADKILVMDRGRIVECGRYAELINADGLFSILAKRQVI